MTTTPPSDYFHANRSVMIKFLPQAYERVLEVGCAAGGFAKVLRSRSCEIWGVEPNGEAASQASQNLDRVLVGTYENVEHEIPDNYFDLVVCNDVIEHMSDHDAFLEKIKLKMRPGASLVASIPNVRHITCLFKLLVLRDWPYSDSGILDRTHLRFFTSKSLRRTLLQHSFSLQSFEGLGSIITNGIYSAEKSPLIVDVCYRAVTLLVVALSFGFLGDTQFPQFGFRATLK